MRRFLVWASLVGSVLACTVTAVACWLQTSVVGWIANLGVLAILLLVVMAYERPGRQLLSARLAWVYPLSAVVALVSAVRMGRWGWPHISSTAFGVIVFIAVILSYVLIELREPGDDSTTPLAFPLASGRWMVASGGVSGLNPHLAVTGQAAGLDLVALRPDGARATGVCPRDLGDYESYGALVVSPCAGVVVIALDGEPEPDPHGVRPAPSMGNRLAIECDGRRVVLAHLRPGSLRVAEGEVVSVGQVLAEVGSSGRSSEPHLHIHAEQDGVGLRLRFIHVPHTRLRPGVVIELRSSVSAARHDEP